MMNPNSQGAPDLGAMLKQWWQDCPSFSRFIFYALIFWYLISWISPLLIFMLVNIPYYTVNNFEGNFYPVWRLFTAPFMPNSLLYILFSLLSYMPISGRQERQQGTVRYFLFFLINNLFIQICFTGLMYAISLKYTEYLQQMSFGIWPFIMMEIVIRSNINPDQPTRFFCCPFTIPAKYYPWVFLLIFSLFLGIMWHLLIGVMVGYLRKIYADVYQYNRFLKVSENFAMQHENSLLVAWLQKIPKYISPLDAGEDQLPVSFAQQPSQNQQRPSVATPPSSQPFSGSGYTLGGSSQSRNYQKLEERKESSDEDDLIQENNKQ